MYRGPKHSKVPPKKNAQTSAKTSFVVSFERIEVLVGGPYTSNGVEHPYGHVALRVVTSASDTTYDFGRYGKVWGLGDSKGEGILRVWTEFARYISGEKATGRTTVGYSFPIAPAQAKAVNAFFQAKLQGATLTQDRVYMKQYKLAQDYHAVTCNCTTITIDGVRTARPGFAAKADEFNQGNGLGKTEKFGVRADNWGRWPDELFMPQDLANYIKSLTGASAPTATKIYR